MAGDLAGTYLDQIVAWHQKRAAADDRPLDALLEAALSAPVPRGFSAAIAAAEGTGVIAEIKRRSPSRGPLDEGLDPAELARSYAEGGASCLSVLTDSEHFAAKPGDLGAARAAVSLPVLRKDFTVSSRDVYDARIMGADAVLLIAAVLGRKELGELQALSLEIGLDCLVEVHDETELEWAIEAGASLVGVNQRDLRSFEVDTGRALRLAGQIPRDVVSVAESGIDGPADAARLARGGYDALLVGEALLRAPERGAAVRLLVEAGRRASQLCG